ncbi:hypothetical protein N9S30_00695, partial [bacterium]|nr:hypothetical protein [bacterium]
MFASWSSLEDGGTVSPSEDGGTFPAADDGTVPPSEGGGTFPAADDGTVPPSEGGGTFPAADDGTVPPSEGGGTFPAADDGTVPPSEDGGTFPAADDGTVPVETAPANERGDTQPPSPAPDSSVQAYKKFRVDSSSNRQLRHQAEDKDFLELWASGRWFFNARTESDGFPLNGFIGKSDSYDIQTMEIAWIIASGTPPSNRGTYNTFVRLEGSARTDMGKRIGYDGELGVRFNSLPIGSGKMEASATEAFVTLWAASVGIGPRVLLSGVYSNRSVYLLAAYTPLSRVLETKSRPVRGLDDALSRVIVKASLAGLLMLDTKPADVVLDYHEASHRCKQAFIVDYDIGFMSLYDIAGERRKASTRCLFIINSVLFLLAWRQGCVDNLTRRELKKEYEHYPIKTLVQRLRQAVAEAKADSETNRDVLCRVLNKSMFVDRTAPSSTRTSLVFNVSEGDDKQKVEVVARFILYLADFFGHFGGGSPVFCPIDGLKLDEAIWPQLVDASANAKHFDQTI